MKYNRNISRRLFLQQSGLSAVALTIGCYVPANGKKAGFNTYVVDLEHTGTELMAWISIEESGQITIFNHRSEMGQGTWQAIPQIVAEELEVSMERIIVRSAPANPKKFGPQPQEGSFSVRGWYLQLLQAGAVARQMLIEAASKRWVVPMAECYALNGQVIHKITGKSLDYGSLVKEAARLRAPEQVKLKERKDYKLIGKPLARKDIASKVNGTAVFGIDKVLLGMLYAVIERNPRFRGKVKSFDDSAAKSIRGVRHIFKIQRNVFGLWFEGVAVVADSLWAAMQGRKLLRVEWDDAGFEHLDSDQIFSRMHKDIDKPSASEVFESALKNSNDRLEAVYEVPYQSHSCMEPLNCIADVREDSVEVWGPIQEANWIQADLSEKLGIPLEKVQVNMTFLGGGFGRKAFPDYPLEAALISREIKAPVQVVWSREDDMTMGPFRTGAVYRGCGGLDNNKKINALQIVGASQYFGPGQDTDSEPKPVTENSGGIGGLLHDYLQSIPHYSFGHQPTRSPIPTMWWRAPGANIDAFAAESLIDELAWLASADPFKFRRDHLVSKRSQLLAEKLSEVSRWDLMGKNSGRGVAITECFGSCVGQVVKVSKGPGASIKIDKVTAVIDCGWYVNPDTIRAQVEGSIIMALGACAYHATTFKEGKAVETNFHTYPMPRIDAISQIKVHIMENDEAPGGVGEPGVPAFAPALCNAIYDLTGKRIRKLPFSLQEAGI